MTSPEWSPTSGRPDQALKEEGELGVGGLWLPKVDNNMVLPVRVQVRHLVTTADVLHSWAGPAFGVKIDERSANPN